MSGDAFVDPYIYPDTTVLINKAGTKSQLELDIFERVKTGIRAGAGIPTGDFDLLHLRAIHKHLFQDVYTWAGEVRKVEINKGGDQFMFRQFIATGMADIHKRIISAQYFKGLKLEEFAANVGSIIGDVNYAHPFRDGNGRAQTQYLKQLCTAAGHDLDLSFLDQTNQTWIAASRQANKGDYALMSHVIERALLDTRMAFERAHPTIKGKNNNF